MNAEERKIKTPHKTKSILPSLIVILSFLCLILALFPLLHHNRPAPDYWHKCGINLSGLGRAMLIYANDYNYMFPTPSKWCDLLIENGDVTKEHFKCPASKEGPCNYAMNKNIEKLGLKAPPDMVVLYETYPGWNQVGDLGILTTANHEDKGCNVLFSDNHIAFVKKQDLHKLKWKPDEAQKE
ncbi:MAG: hypothetical protein ACYS32_03585 [Planctomycetota bacterium]